MRLIGVLVATAVVVGACSSETGGDPAAEEPGVPDPSVVGVVETTRRPLEPKSQTCDAPERPAGAQAVSFVQGGKPGTPVVTIMMPDTWTSAVTQNDSTMTLTGPAGLTGTLTVSPSELGAAEAFEKYADDITATSPTSSVSAQPGELCGYSGQKLTGVVSANGGPPVEYRDRIAHVWTNGPSYLIAIRVEGPQGDAALSEAADLILGDIGIRLP